MNDQITPLLLKIMAITPAEALGILYGLLPGLVIGTLVYLGLWYLKRLASQRYLGAQKTWWVWLWRFLEGLRGWFVAVVAGAAALRLMPLTPVVDNVLSHVVAVAFYAQLGLWAMQLLQAWANHFANGPGNRGARATITSTITMIGAILIWAVVGLLVLNNFGVNITALVAGLGIGGVALAFAMQNLLKDLLASVAMMFDRPFNLGDFIRSKDNQGTIEKIGLKTTHLRSISGEQVIISNDDLLGSRIHNYGRLSERRQLLTFTLRYGLPADKLDAVPALVQTAVESQKPVRFVSCYFRNYRLEGLDFEIEYYVETPEYKTYLSAQHAINLAIYRTLEANGIPFAMAGQPVFVAPPPEPEAAAAVASVTTKPEKRSWPMKQKNSNKSSKKLKPKRVKS